ncbi:uncharacterized protein EI90DRAFT_509281 [Cantharellus anzutake]|uniref:uncharacterized protein n=1 Tax=Cantharellus anzutake TaxID=1750568 RepID=UPI001907F752|nr:uncharacterized protein EI90DRAFT_509281 [Cantharellus anzutake]KAF8334120.1 hypothetical protein EI90DRAFT_509281 [Cantharellus anzutake]
MTVIFPHPTRLGSLLTTSPSIRYAPLPPLNDRRFYYISDVADPNRVCALLTLPLPFLRSTDNFSRR